MASIINKMVSWAAREAEQLASKSGVSLEKAAEEIADKYGQKAFSATAKPPVEEFATSTPSMFLGDANAPSNRSLREMISPNVEESITAREASKYQEPVVTRDLVPVGERRLALPASKIQAPVREESERLALPAGQEMLALPPGRKFPSRSETSASEDFAAGLEDLDMNLSAQPLAPRARKAAAMTAGAVGLSQVLRGDVPPSPQVATSVAGSPEEAATKPTGEIKNNIKAALNAVDKSIKEAGGTPGEVSAESAEEEPSTDPVLDRFQQERNRLYSMYEQAKTRNEWLEVAQLIGQAITQYGAARYGQRTGRDMSGIQLPSVDYGARTQQEFKLLENRLRDIGDEQEREQKLADRLKADKREEERDRREQERIALETRRVELAEREARKIKESPEESQIRREKRADERKEFKNKVDSLKELISAQQILTSKDTSKKQKEKAREVVIDRAAKAGVDIDAVRDASPGKNLFGWESGVDEKKVLSNFKIILDDFVKSRSSAGQTEQKSDTMTTPAGTPPSLSAEDQQALDWATNNPKDPRAAEIRKRLGR